MADYFLNVEKSVCGQKWRARCEDEEAVTAIEQAKGLDNLTARLLVGRDVTPDDVEGFLAPTLRNSLPDPSSLQDMDKAAARIVKAVQASEKITVFADYDVDGGTSAAQLIRWGRHYGVELGLYVPDRVEEGYGPSTEAFEALKSGGNDLVITVDCGAAAREALEHAAKIDLSVIVIDHHLMHGAMPPAYALVNPNREDDNSGLGHLAAAGVTFMLLVALNREARKSGLGDGPKLLDLLGLTALGTVCDVVPLTGVNRAFVAQGLKVLSQGGNIGINALADVAGATGDFTTYHAGFILGPRINAGGRIGRASMGAELLSTENGQTAYGHAAELDRVNNERKLMQDQILNEALEAASKLPENRAITLVAMEGWHPGVIGIVAGRLKDRFDRPAIVIGVDEDGLGKGSGRSMTGVNLGEAITQAKQAGLLISGGGHAMAGGLTVEADKIEAVTAFFEEALEEDVKNARANLSLKIDALIAPSAATLDLTAKIATVGPYGAGNPQPVFAMADMRIAYAQRVRGGHVRCAFEDGSGGRINGICFRADESGLADVLLAPNAPKVHIAGRIKEDSWKGRKKVDFQLIDMAIAD